MSMLREARSGDLEREPAALDSSRTRRRAAAFRILCALDGGCFLTMALAADWLVGESLKYGTLRIAGLVMGAGLLLLAGLIRDRWVPPVLLKVSISVTSTLLVIVAVETGFRASGHQFDERVRAFLATPIYYRLPTVPVGDIFFRRPGPDRWTGRVLATGLKLSGGLDDTYRDELEITASYDQDGMRNPEDLTDWEVAVVGDSFTELGYLPYEDLFTTLLGRQIGLRVKNLGVSACGPLTYAYYLRTYGKSASARHAVMVFYEGNDIQNLLDEHQALEAFKATGRREYREVHPHRSVLYAVYNALGTLFHGNESKADALLRWDGRMVPVTIRHGTRGRGSFSPAEIATVEVALSDWAAAARSLGMKPWLVYVPCKHRIYYDIIEHTSATSRRVRSWQPTDTPSWIEEVCKRHDIGFIDLIAPFTEAARRGVLLYNAVWDTHLNRAGSRACAEAIAERLKPSIGR